MPRKDIYYINDDFVKDIIEVRNNLGNTLDKPFELPKGIAKTVIPPNRPNMNEWFDYVHNSLRQRDLFGNLDIK